MKDGIVKNMNATIRSLVVATKPTDEETERAIMARKQFELLPPDLQAKLLLIASRHSIVLVPLAQGQWLRVKRALYGLSMAHTKWDYTSVTAEFDRATINRLDQ